MYRIAQNIWIDRLRAIKVRGEVVDVDTAIDLVGSDGRQVTEGRLTLDLVTRHMQALPPDQQLVLTLVSIDGLSYKEAADKLKVPIGTVMSRLARARKALAASVEESGVAHSVLVKEKSRE
jgi:RNA polymerase sigma-70 factor (ECF subfamily)